ncbi:hypothetical protein ACFQRL_14290 [Microbacterium fluvii]|uniref:Uncharacterized protein n=1 Tax=Microbacterium fluvii TaxID=415215 RepID=A0ABW2HGT0_9MICO|nr:hypothetical protein [Microbacterium fluvii]MCU4673760.1 hypothetical protein [Microbacterium fluvii]
MILPLRARDMTAWGIGRRLDRLNHHATHESKHSDGLRGADRRNLHRFSAGTVVDGFDNAMAEAVNNL